MKSILTTLIISTMLSSAAFATEIACVDPYNGIALTLVRDASGTSYEISVPTALVTAPVLPLGAAGPIKLTGKVLEKNADGCSFDANEPRLLECHAEKYGDVTLKTADGANYKFKAIINFSLQEVTTRRAGGIESERVGSIEIMGNNPSLTVDINAAHFGPSDGSHSCVVR